MGMRTCQLVLLFSILSANLVGAFVSQAALTSRAHQSGKAGIWLYSEKDEKTKSTETENKTEPKDIPKIKIPKPVQLALEGVYTVWSVGLTSLCVSISFGLVLNIFGYGYQVERRPLGEVSSKPLFSVRVDTIQQLRTDNQFQRAIRNSVLEQQTTIANRDR